MVAAGAGRRVLPDVRRLRAARVSRASGPERQNKRMTWLDVVELQVSKRQLYCDHEGGFIFLGFRPPAELRPDLLATMCMEHSEVVPWCHVSLADVERHKAAAAIVKRLNAKRHHLLRRYENIYLYMEPRGMHARKGESADVDTMCSVDRANCRGAFRALIDVLRSIILCAASEMPNTPVRNIGREPHVSVLNLLCLPSKSAKIGFIRDAEDDRQLSFERDSTFKKSGSHAHVLKNDWADFVKEQCVNKKAMLGR